MKITNYVSLSGEDMVAIENEDGSVTSMDAEQFKIWQESQEAQSL